MKHKFGNILATVSAAVVLAVLTQEEVSAGTTIGFGSSVGATNVTSAGGDLNEDFMFQLGTFEDGFQPTNSNTDEWLGAWRPASDREGEPLEGNTAAYSTEELGGGFPAGFRANSFSGSVILDHNEPPFDLGGQLYIWGYDQRATPGAAEWILISDPAWIWPDGSANLPAASYAVSGATVVVLGEIKGDGFEMKTAAVTVSDSSVDFYEGWLAQNFSAEQLGDESLEETLWGEFADPDADGLTNLMEYYTGNDPQVAAAVAALSEPQISGETITVEFRRSLSAQGVVGQVEWSTDLTSWSRLGIEQNALEEDDTHEVMSATLPISGAGQAYFRLAVQRAQ